MIDTGMRRRSAPRTRMPRRSWITLVAVEALALFQAVFLLVHGGWNGAIDSYVGRPSSESPVGVVLNAFVSSWGLWWLAVVVLTATITLIPYRRGERWAWAVLWTFPVLYVAELISESISYQDAPADTGGFGVVTLYYAVPFTIGLLLGARHVLRREATMVTSPEE